jgi:hypothetical protein
VQDFPQRFSRPFRCIRVKQVAGPDPSVKIEEATARQLESWDDRVERSINGTIFHTRRFLAYHGDRFSKSERFLVALDGSSIKAQIALTVSDEDGSRVARSPYGGSYGSFIFLDQPGFSDAKDLVASFNEYLLADDVNRFVMTPPIACCTKGSLDTVYFVMLTNGYRSINRDLSSIVSLPLEQNVVDLVSSRARNMSRKAQARGVRIERGNLGDFWRVLQLTFEKHGTSPTHSLENLEYLIREFPEQIYVDVAYGSDGEALAGIGCFAINRRVNSSFYLCQNPLRAEDQALSFLIINALADSHSAGFSYFDLGTSTVGMVPRENIFRFKESYSKESMFRETLEWTRS